MAILSDKDIGEAIAQGWIVEGGIESIEESQIQPSSLDLTLSETFLLPNWEYFERTTQIIKNVGFPGVRPYNTISSPFWEEFNIGDMVTQRELRAGDTPSYQMAGYQDEGDSENWISGMWMMPDDFWLGSTRETIRLPDYLTGRLNGKSTLGRWGLSIHITAGFVDAGFRGRLTLEIKNEGPFMLLLEPGMRIAQMDFETMTSRANVGYRGKYQGQSGVTAPRTGGLT